MPFAMVLIVGVVLAAADASTASGVAAGVIALFFGLVWLMSVRYYAPQRAFLLRWLATLADDLENGAPGTAPASPERQPSPTP
jgi:hypothetical protein